MKKLICFCMILAMTGCTAHKEEEQVMTANPFLTLDTLQQAEESSGLSMNLPERIADHDISIYRSMPDSMLEIIYTRDEDRICVRKQAGDQDISGYWPSEDDEEKELVHEDLTIHLQCREDRIRTAAWIQDGYSYAVDSDSGISEQELRELVNTLCFTVD